MNLKKSIKRLKRIMALFILFIVGLLVLPQWFRGSLETKVFAATFTVTNTNVIGPGSLRQAILDANGNPGADTISFNINSGCDVTTNVCTITPTFVSPLPAIVDPVTIEGYTQPGASANTLAAGDNAVILIEISGAVVTNNASALTITNGGAGSTVRGLAINGGFNAGVLIVDSSNPVQHNVIEGCFLGTNAAGLVANGNNIGVLLDPSGNSSFNLIGGTTAAARNLISGNNTGVSIQSGASNVVAGNFIGTNKSGTAALANSTALDLRTNDNLIGGATVAARNVIAGNSGTGVVVNSNGNTTSGNSIQGNFIGTDVTGTNPLGFADGVRLSFNTTNTHIGDLSSVPGAPPGNVISGNGTGIVFGNNVNNNTIQGNLIGTKAGGIAALGNSLDGINIRGSSNLVGGPTATAANVISGNGGQGIRIGTNNATVQDNLVQGNFIGTDVTGSNPLGNTGSGVLILDAFANRVLGNAIAFNGDLGIDLGADGVTINDNCDGDIGSSNNLQNFPIITNANSVGGNTTITGTLNSTANTSFRIEFFASASPDPSAQGEGQTFIGFTTVTTGGICTASINVSFPLTLSGGQFITATSTDPANNTSEFSNARFVVSPTAANGTVNGQVLDQSARGIEGTVIRLSGTQNRKTITDADGFYQFDNVPANGFYTATPSRLNFSFSPGERSFTQLGNNTAATFTGVSVGNAHNPLDTPEYFVRQHYIDFLAREPEEAGFSFWSDQLLGCGNDIQCVERRRINVSAAYFLSIEFQQTGYLVYRMYLTAFGNLPDAPVPVHFDEFVADMRQLGGGVIVNRQGWEQILENNKTAFANEFASRPRFGSLYANTADTDFVAALNRNVGEVLSAAEQQVLVSELASGVRTRSQVLRVVAENNELSRLEFSKAFVLMQYFGYLRRDPNQGPDHDFTGYNFWLNKLNQVNGNFEQAEMVKAFLISGEYRQRFVQ